MVWYTRRGRGKSARASAGFFLIVLAAATVQYGCGEVLDTVELRVNGHVLLAEIARTADQQEQGLMHRTSLAPDRGMLFIYDRDKKLTFWMKNTSIPLSIAFLASDGTIKEIYDMKPFSLKMVGSQHSVRYALEVNQGFFEQYGISVGDRVEIPEGIEARERVPAAAR